MIIKNANVVLRDDVVVQKDIYISNGVFTDSDEGFSSEDLTQIDATGLYAVPGLIDVHFHGAVGEDFCEADLNGLRKILEYEASCGIMAVMPTTMTFPENRLNEIIDTVLDLKDNDTGADILGINMEGPFISTKKTAAQNRDYIIPGNVEMLKRLLNRSKGLIKMVDIAPEVDQNMELIDKFSDKVIFSLAHTDTDYEKALEAFHAGASHLTHTFNAMNGIGHRAPGPILAARDAGAYVELICDGVHIHDSVIRMMFDLFDSDKIILISDSMMATGLGDGEYSLGGLDVVSKGRRCTQKVHPEIIAGSNTNLYECMKYAIKSAGIPIWKAIKASSENPARELGIDDKYGKIVAGCYGNLLLVNEDFEIKYLISHGCIRG